MFGDIANCVSQVASNSSLVQRAARATTGGVGASELGAAILTPEQARLGSQVISTMTPQLVATQKAGQSRVTPRSVLHFIYFYFKSDIKRLVEGFLGFITIWQYKFIYIYIYLVIIFGKVTVVIIL